MNILWFAWKDMHHPQAGGAELIMTELINRQLKDGHHVTLLTAQYEGSKAQETLDNGLQIIRRGKNRYTHSLHALMYYLRHLRGKHDIIIETVNTMPYFSLLFRGRTAGVALYHQLARDIWYFETKSPLSQLGYYIIEPFSTWLLGKARAPLVTVSESTKQDLARFGWDKDRTHIISEGIRLEPVPAPEKVQKSEDITLLSLGAIRSMKRTLDQIKAFEIAKTSLPTLRLVIAGDASDQYGRTVLEAIAGSPYAEDISYLGRVDETTKKELMQKAHVIAVTSVKEGWGLIVTEAASQGTPAVVYDVDGLRDSVRNGQTGFVVPPTPDALAEGLVRLMSNRTLYRQLQKNAWQWSRGMTFERCYHDFKQVLKEASS